MQAMYAEREQIPTLIIAQLYNFGRACPTPGLSVCNYNFSHRMMSLNKELERTDDNNEPGLCAEPGD